MAAHDPPRAPVHQRGIADRITEAVVVRPGMTRYEISKAIGHTRHAIERHLRELVDDGIIHEHVLGRRRVYSIGVPAGAVPTARLLWREPLCRDVLDAMAHTPASTRDVANALRASEKAVRRHVKSLERAGILEQGDRRGEYRLAQEHDAIAHWLLAYWRHLHEEGSALRVPRVNAS